MALISEKSLSRLFNLLVSRFWLTIVASLAVIAVFAAGLPQLNFVDVSIRNHFNDDDPHLLNLEQFEETYAVSDSVLVVVDPPADTIFTREALTAIEQLTETLWQTPYATRVSSITNHSHTEGIEDDLIVENLVANAESLDEEQIKRIEHIALTTQETAGRFVSRDGRLAGLIVSFALQEDEEGRRNESRKQVLDALDQLIDEQRAAHPEFTYYVYGELLLQRAIASTINEDMAVLAPLAFGAMLLGAFILLRSVWGVIGIVAMLIAVMVSSFGFAGWSGIRYFGESGATVFVLLAIVVAHAVHLIQGMANGMLDGMPRQDAIVQSLEINCRPIFLTSLTTAIGFLSLNFSEMPPFRVMGNIVAFGSMIAFVFSVSLLPALLAILPVGAPRQSRKITHQFERLGNFVVARRTGLLWAFVILFAVSAVGVSRIEFNDNNIKLLEKTNELRQAADFINDNFSGLDAFEYSLDSGREGGVTDIEYLAQVEAFAHWLRAQPEVSHVTSIVDVMKRLNQNLHGDAEDAYALPENSELAAQFLVLYEFSLPVGLDLNNLIDFDRRASRMTAVIEGLPVREQIALDERSAAWLAQNAPQMQTSATGVAIISAYSVMRNIVRMLIGTAAAMGIVSLLLMLVFKSARLGVLSLIPNFLPAVMAMGIWGHAVGTVSIAVSIVTAIAFGIVVDDTIHLLSKYLRSRKEGLSPAAAIIPTFTQVGRPLLTTTFIFALGFFVFGASDLLTNQILGLMVGMTVIIALVADFLLFPPLLVSLDKASGTDSQAAA